MNVNGLLIGEVAKRSGASRKALRLYEAAGILPKARRTRTGYRIYGADTLEVLAFVRQAQRLGFTLGEIKEISAWDDKNFVAAVERAERKNVIMAGVTTDICSVGKL